MRRSKIKHKNLPSGSVTMTAMILSIVVVGVWYASGNIFNDSAQAQALGAKETTSFDECVAFGGAVLERFPRECFTSMGVRFVENIGNILEKKGMIRVNTPSPNDIISSPLEIKGEAKEDWFYQSQFPVTLINAAGDIIDEMIATAQDDSSTEGFMPFTVNFEFTPPSAVVEGKTTPTTSRRAAHGTLILRKANPSGLKEYSDALEIPVRFDVSSEE